MRIVLAERGLFFCACFLHVNGHNLDLLKMMILVFPLKSNTWGNSTREDVSVRMGASANPRNAPSVAS
jgi:hypothetical protein